jgi:hypothetical protein
LIRRRTSALSGELFEQRPALGSILFQTARFNFLPPGLPGGSRNALVNPSIEDLNGWIRGVKGPDLVTLFDEGFGGIREPRDEILSKTRRNIVFWGRSENIPEDALAFRTGWRGGMTGDQVLRLLQETGPIS